MPINCRTLNTPPHELLGGTWKEISGLPVAEYRSSRSYMDGRCDPAVFIRLLYAVLVCTHNSKICMYEYTHNIKGFF